MRALIWALVLNGGFLILEAAVGLYTGSLALLSDAAHMVSDVGALVMALVAAKLATRAASDRMTFGLVRTEVLGGFVNGLTLLAAVAWIVVEAIDRLINGSPSFDFLPVLVVGTAGLLINLGSAFFLWRASSDSVNIRAALAHMIADALGSVAAMVAAVALYFGYPIADPLASLIVAAIVAYSSWGVLKESAGILLQLPPHSVKTDDVRAALLSTDGVSTVDQLRLWTLDGRRHVISAHLTLADGAHGEDVVGHAAHRLEHDFDAHVTLQVTAHGEHGHHEHA